MEQITRNRIKVILIVPIMLLLAYLIGLGLQELTIKENECNLIKENYKEYPTAYNESKSFQSTILSCWQNYKIKITE